MNFYKTKEAQNENSSDTWHLYILMEQSWFFIYSFKELYFLSLKFLFLFIHRFIHFPTIIIFLFFRSTQV